MLGETQMQDIHSIVGGGGARFFGGGGGGVDRRLRPNLHHQNSQSLKCPRCDSLNTKFCYYNNYNLSQPRHFCKSCRRYWTKGGVLRNVPVGGGCRKPTKRGSGGSKPKQPSAKRSSSSHSSSESSSLTASTTAAKPPPQSTAANPSASTPTTLLNFPDSRFFNFPVDHSTDGGGGFTEIGSFTSMMTSGNDHSFLGFNMGDISGAGYRLQQDNEGTVVQDERPEQQQQHQWEDQQHQQQQQQMEEMSAGFLDRTAQIDLSGMENRGNNGGVLEWQGGAGDQAMMFDLTGSYWSQTQWPDNDHSLYLP